MSRAVGRLRRQQLLDFLAQEGIDRVVVVSPHLDDAGFSTCGLLLSGLAAGCHVVTVFTDSSPDVDQSWAQEAGFADSVVEHAARRLEDRDAMRRLGVGFSHLGFKSGEFTAEAAQSVPGAVAAAAGPSAQGVADRGVLWLLPAGAGFTGRLHNVLWRFSRALGRPGGTQAHPEHVLVRDRLMHVLQARGARIGFYGEFPYLWLDPGRILKWRLENACRGRLDRFVLNVDPRLKLAVCEMYGSQAPLVLGTTADERLRTLGHAEAYFIAARPRSA